MNNNPDTPGEYYLSNGIELTESQRRGEDNDLFRKFFSSRHVKLSDYAALEKPSTLNKIMEQIREYDFLSPKNKLSDNRSHGIVSIEGKDFCWDIIEDEDSTTLEKRLYIYPADEDILV